VLKSSRITADIHSVAPHIGRGGWTWYTASAGWLSRAGIEAILDFRLQRAFLLLAPASAHPQGVASVRDRACAPRDRGRNPNSVDSARNAARPASCVKRAVFPRQTVRSRFSIVTCPVLHADNTGGSPQLTWRTKEGSQVIEYDRETARSDWGRIKVKFLSLITRSCKHPWTSSGRRMYAHVQPAGAHTRASSDPSSVYN
jgi:hypothetical protein